MKWLGLIFILLSSVIVAGEELEIELNSGNAINIDAYASEGDTLFLYLPSERGFGIGHVPTMQQLAFEGYDVWVADLHSSYMIAKYRSSIDRFDIDDLLELVNFANNKSFKNLYFLTSGRGAQLALKVAYQWQLKNPGSSFLKGHILHSPHLIKGKSDLGKAAKYVDIAKHSNLPIYLLLPQFGTKYFRGEEIATQLEKGGSSVFIHRLKAVHGGFHMRNVKDLTKIDIKAKDNLSDVYQQAVQLLNTVNFPKLSQSNNNVLESSKVILSEPILKRYTGKQDIQLKLKTFDGQMLDIDLYKGQVVLLNFWASWCKPCVEEIPSLVRLQQKFNQDNFKIITINVGESKEQIIEFMKKVKFDLPILLDFDGQAVKNWGVYAYPSNFLLDKNGTIRYAYRGALEWDADPIANTIKTLF
jgi:Peroxiredoxin